MLSVEVGTGVEKGGEGWGGVWWGGTSKRASVVSCLVRPKCADRLTQRLLHPFRATTQTHKQQQQSS